MRSNVLLLLPERLELIYTWTKKFLAEREVQALRLAYDPGVLRAPGPYAWHLVILAVEMLPEGADDLGSFLRSNPSSVASIWYDSPHDLPDTAPIADTVALVAPQDTDQLLAAMYCLLGWSVRKRLEA